MPRSRFPKAAVHFAPRNGRIPLFARASERGRPASEWFSVKNVSTGEAAEITINGEIGEDWFGEGTNAKDFKAALDQIPRDRKILVLIDSPGGNVWDGLAIANLLKERRANVTVKIYGVALSIASVIAIAGSKVILCKTSQYMAHDPWSGLYVVGTEEDIAEEAERARNALKAAKRSIIIAYKERTGKSEEDIAALMKAETWYVGQEAKDAGFVDEISDEEALLNSFDLSNFKRVPEAFRKLQNSAAKNSGQNITATDLMDKKKLVALLKKHGATVDDNATIEQLEAQLEQVLTAKAKEQPTTPPTPPPAPSAVDNAALAIVQAQLKEMKAARDSERRANVTSRVDALILERRVTAAERDFLIENAIADERHLTNAAARPQVLPPEGLRVEITSESPSDILNGLKSRRAPISAMIRGETPDEAAIFANAAANFRDIQANLGKIKSFIIHNAHSVDSALQQHVIMAEGMRAFKRRILALNAFSTVFNSVPLKGSDKIEIPYQALYSTASTDFVQANGYVMAEDGAVSKKEITINARKYQPFQFNSAYLNRQPFFNIQTLFMQRAEQLGVDVVNTVLANVTLVNFGAASFTGAASTFDKDDMIDLKVIADNAYWPLIGRSAMLKHEYEGALLKSIVGLAGLGVETALRQGVTGRIADFDVFGNAGIPANAQNLVGFINMPSALLVATSPVIPAPGVRKNLVAYDVVIDPDTGAAFEYRYWGNPDKDEDREVVECNFGHAVGEAAALKRLVSA